MIAKTSGEIFFPRLAARSIEPRTLRTRASTSSEFSGANGSEIGVTLAFTYSPPPSTESTLQRESPCISMRIRPSGSLSIRMMIATVPTVYRSSCSGSSLLRSFCDTKRIIRFSLRAVSTALTERSRETNSGTIING